MGRCTLAEHRPTRTAAITSAVYLTSTARHSTARHSTARHITAQHDTSQHSTARHITAQHDTAQYSAKQQSTAQHSKLQHSKVQQDTAQYNTTQQSTAQHDTASACRLGCSEGSGTGNQYRLGAAMLTDPRPLREGLRQGLREVHSVVSIHPVLSPLDNLVLMLLFVLLSAPPEYRESRGGHSRGLVRQQVQEIGQQPKRKEMVATRGVSDTIQRYARQ
jgi:hypothetical protein